MTMTFDRRTLLHSIPFVLTGFVFLSVCLLSPSRGSSQSIASTSSHAAGQASFSLITDRDAILTLHNPFHFQVGDDPRWSDPGFDDSAWTLVRGDRNWRSIGFPNLSGLAWYRFKVTLPAGDEAYSIRLPRIATAYQLFIDGKIALTAGDMPPHARMYVTSPELVALPGRSRRLATTLQIAIRVWHDPAWAAYTSGGPTAAMSIGRTSLISEELALDRLGRLWRNSDWFDLTALDLLAAMMALVLFLLSSSEREYLWFCILALGDGLNHAIRLWARFNPHSVHAVESLESICYAAFLASSLLFYRELLGGRASIAFRISLVSCALWFTDTQLTVIPHFPSSAENVGELLFSVPIYAWILSLIFRRSRQRCPDARLLALPVTLLVGTAFYYQLLFTIGTFGHVEAMRYYPILHGLFYADVKDISEAFFLIAMLLILGNRFARTRREKDRTTAELEAAGSVQRVLVPESPVQVQGLRIATAYYPAQQVGGDFFQVVPLPTGDTLLVIGDVAGKGVSAALTVSLIVGTLRTLADYVHGPGEILSGINRRLFGRGSGFTTCIAMQFSANLKSLTIANAGHLPAYVDGKELETEFNLPLGLVPDAEYPEMTYSLHEGQHIVLLTDGVPEAMYKRELFGFARTLAIVSEGATSIADAARNFGQTDDITVLTIDVLGSGNSADLLANPHLETEQNRGEPLFSLK